MDSLVYGISLYFDGLSDYYSIKAKRFSRDKFKQMMSKKKVTYPQLAEHLCVTTPRAWQIVNGYRSGQRIRNSYFPRIARFLDEI
jgi:hypothetical protein